jgi:hypothetical protein
MVSRLRPWLAVLTAVMLAGALAGPGSASASGSGAVVFTLRVTLPFTHTDPVTQAKHASLPGWATAGPCAIYPEATVVLSYPDIYGNGWGALHMTTYTSRGGAGDTLRGHFWMLDSNDRPLADVPMDGAYMPERYMPYTSEYYQPMHISRADFARVVKVEWHAGC